MKSLFFDDHIRYSNDDVIDFLINYDDVVNKITYGSILYFCGLFILGHILFEYLNVTFISVFIGFLIMSIAYTIQITKMTMKLDENEKKLIPLISANLLIEIVEHKNIPVKTKEMVLSLTNKRKLTYALSLCKKIKTQAFIQRIQENI